MSTATATNPVTTRSVCTFRLADLYLGVDVTRVQEVLRWQDTTRVPLVSAVVGGLINLRGEIVTTVDLRRRLGLPELDEHAEPPMNVVIRAEDGIVSLLVDEIDDVLEVEESAFEEPPPTLARAARELLSGVYKLDQRLLLVLDTVRMLDLHSQDVSTNPNRSGRTEGDPHR